MGTLKEDDPFLGVMAQILAQQQIAAFNTMCYINEQESKRKEDELRSRLTMERQQAEIEFLRSQHAKE